MSAQWILKLIEQANITEKAVEDLPFSQQYAAPYDEAQYRGLEFFLMKIGLYATEDSLRHAWEVTPLGIRMRTVVRFLKNYGKRAPPLKLLLAKTKRLYDEQVVSLLSSLAVSQPDAEVDEAALAELEDHLHHYHSFCTPKTLARNRDLALPHRLHQVIHRCAHHNPHPGLPPIAEKLTKTRNAVLTTRMNQLNIFHRSSDASNPFTVQDIEQLEAFHINHFSHAYNFIGERVAAQEACRRHPIAERLRRLEFYIRDYPVLAPTIPIIQRMAIQFSLRFRYSQMEHIVTFLLNLYQPLSQALRENPQALQQCEGVMKQYADMRRVIDLTIQSLTYVDPTADAIGAMPIVPQTAEPDLTRVKNTLESVENLLKQMEGNIQTHWDCCMGMPPMPPFKPEYRNLIGVLVNIQAHFEAAEETPEVTVIDDGDDTEDDGEDDEEPYPKRMRL